MTPGAHQRGVGSPPTWFFDCDGVLLDSNAAKTAAFAAVAAAYGDAASAELVRHHVQHAGVSRFAKFAWFFDNVLCRDPHPGEIDTLIHRFGERCALELQRCRAEPHAAPLLTALANAGCPLHVVSGGLETEVLVALKTHGLADAFSTVNGSPRTKAQILGDLGQTQAPGSRGVFVGDSRHDMEVAAQFGLRRVFVTQWSDFEGWQHFMTDNPDIVVVRDLRQLASLLGSVDSAL